VSSETASVGDVFILRKSVRLPWLMSGEYGWRSEFLASTCQLVENCKFVPGPLASWKHDVKSYVMRTFVP